MASAVPKPEPGDWLKAAADELKQGDKATLALLQESYRNVNKILQSLPDAPDAAFGDLVYRAQLERTRRALLVEQAKLFDKLGDKVAARRLRSASRAAKLSAASDAALLRLVGEGEEGRRLYEGANITAQRTVETLLARAKLSAVPLAERIYNTKSWMNKRLDTLIVSTMAAGLNAQKFAKVARDWFAPSVPGGTRYAAMRLARTEINNAFHATSIVYAQDKPWVSQMEWHLSKSHPTPDKCNEIAAASPYDVYLIPRKPHPQCMCYVTEVTPDEDEWIDRFVAGEFDDYLDAELDKADQQLGIKKEPANAGQRKVSEGASGGATSRGIPAPSLAGAGQPQRTSPEEFDQQVAEAAKDEDALAVSPWGLDRRFSLRPPNTEWKRCLNAYTGDWYQDINSVLRGGKVRLDSDRERVQDFIDGMDAAYAAMPASEKAVVTYRGMRNGKLFGDRSKNDLTGFEWKEEAFVSTAALQKRAMAFTGRRDPGILMRILVPQGSKLLEASGATLEAELLLDRNTNYRIVRDNGIGPDGIRLLDVEMVPTK